MTSRSHQFVRSVGCIFSEGDRVKTGSSTPSPDMVNPGISGVDPGT